MSIPSETSQVASPRPRMRAVLSVLVTLHVFAVFVGPWALPPQSSELATACERVFKPYLDALALNNGYRYFAPEPTPSHLVRYEIMLKDGTIIKRGVVPDLAVHKPRLFYHRHLMLSEFVNTLSNYDGLKDSTTNYIQAYAKHVAEENDAPRVRLYLRRHHMPKMSAVLRGMRLTDEKLYDERLLTTYTREER